MYPKIIAFYLPQYHPTPDNDKWWGKGFTEWTNVGKARPLFKGHYQPKVPADLGYYDLRLSEVREAQAELAKEAGIYGFCYYHYWFGNGKQELEMPFNEVLNSGKPDFPFMLCWANTSWHKKFWNKDGEGSSQQILANQIYPGEQDIIQHFYKVLPAFKDKRYIKIDGKPLFMIYVPLQMDYGAKFLKIWKKLAQENNIKDIIFIAQTRTIEQREQNDFIFKQGYDFINTERLKDVFMKYKKGYYKVSRFLKINLFNIFSNRIRYQQACKILNAFEDKNEKIIPTLIPNWDHTPRSSKGGFVFTESTPKNFYFQCLNFFKTYPHKPFYFLKSWNEWGEGNYMEPDLKYGKGYINALKKAIHELQLKK